MIEHEGPDGTDAPIQGPLALCTWPRTTFQAPGTSAPAPV